jgi:hypothetical protein
VADKGFMALWNRGQGLYALAQPYLEGRRVVELWPVGAGDPEPLRGMGARDVAIEAPATPPLAFADGTLDLVVCPSFPPAGEADPQTWFKEIARVLSPSGFCLLRVPVGLWSAAEAEGEAEEEYVADLGDSAAEREDEGEFADPLEAADEDPHVSGGVGFDGGLNVESSASWADEEDADDELRSERFADDDEALGVAGPPAARATADATGDRRADWRALLAEMFPAVEVIEEVAFGGVSFRVPGTEDLAIVGDLSPLAAPAEYDIVVCAKDRVALPTLGESLLVPLAGEVYGDVPVPAMVDADAPLAMHEVAAGVHEAAEEARRAAERLREEAARERDEARLEAASQRDQDAAKEATIASLREGTERQWRRIAELESALAKATQERDEAVRRAETAEESARTMEATLRRREWEVAGLERDVDHFNRVSPKG